MAETPPARGPKPDAIVQAFWHGPVSTMERLSVTSFVANGHSVHVYAYDDLGEQLPGAVVKDAREIVPKRRSVFRDSHGSFAGFSDLFRYRLLLDRGGWWIDLDMICLRPFDLPGEYVFATEPDGTVTGAVMRVPAGAGPMQYAYERSIGLGRRRRQWGAIGPRLLAETVDVCGLRRYAVGQDVFVPVDWPDWESYLDPVRTWQLDPNTRAVHLWNSMWAKRGRDTDATYDPGCLYEVPKRRYLVGSRATGAA
jgi:hypothetical protein